MNTHNKQYQQLNLEQRYHIFGLRKAGMSLRDIATDIGVHFSTISREINRNKAVDGYDPKVAQKLSIQRKSTSFKASKRTKRTDEILDQLVPLSWSPESIHRRMLVECKPYETLSHSTIYRRIEENRLQGGAWYKHLPRYGKTRWKGGKRSKGAGVRLIPNRVDISLRPEVVDERSRIGDWEGDTVHGQDAHLVTLVERKTRFTLCKRVFSKTKDEVCSAMINMLKSVSAKLTLTFDNGGEFADHERVTEKTGINIFFAKPYASWQRGTNENTNGRLRRLWPKKFKMASLTDDEIEDAIFLLNFTPRKILNGLTPFEAFTGQRVALIA